jgi:hypothetical protein
MIWSPRPGERTSTSKLRIATFPMVPPAPVSMIALTGVPFTCVSTITNRECDKSASTLTNPEPPLDGFEFERAPQPSTTDSRMIEDLVHQPLSHTEPRLPFKSSVVIFVGFNRTTFGA